ncbi:hypothetical protein LJB99_04130 [Deltaproteobacteria bacterium OttesenSCG-928-K17]|nr:hypothetical protein [Deltaproteobacteria bacterium OttesenSCG-928-K17]
MKSWLPTLVEKLPGSPVLAMSASRNLAKGAVYDRQGKLLAGSLGSPVLAAQAAEEARLMAPGECRLLAQQTQLSLECLAPDEAAARFWNTALENQQGAWASWLLTMPRLEEGGLKFTRHLLSAFGPWTTPRLPEEMKDHWSLLPLKSGLGRLFVLGDDALAMETAALGGRTGLTVTWLTTESQPADELEEALTLGDFDLRLINNWDELTEDFFEEIGLKDGVRLVVTAPLPSRALENFAQIRPAYLSNPNQKEAAAGLFPEALTTTQKALGLIAQML